MSGMSMLVSCLTKSMISTSESGMYHYLSHTECHIKERTVRLQAGSFFYIR